MSTPQDALVWRRLGPPDLQAVEALHRRSIAGLGPAVVKAEHPGFFAGILESRGLVTGVCHGDALVAYGVLQHDLLPEDDPRRLLGLGDDIPVRKLAGAAVDPGWQGGGLHRALAQHRIELAGAEAVIYATSAPGNPASWRSLLASGLVVRALAPHYGGHLRYVMARVPDPLDPACRALDEPDLEVPDTDLERQARLLAEGWRGMAPAKAGGGIRWRRFTERASTTGGVDR
jgi:hypothetical protein